MNNIVIKKKKKKKLKKTIIALQSRVCVCVYLFMYIFFIQKIKKGQKTLYMRVFKTNDNLQGKHTIDSLLL